MMLLNKHRGLLLNLLALFGTLFSLPQMAAAQCPIVVGGSDFLDAANSDTIWVANFNTIKQVGPSGNTFSSADIYADSAQMFLTDTNCYAITTNPHLLNPEYIDMDQNMFVAKTTDKLQNLFSYQVDGLKKGASYTISFKIVTLLTDTSACYKANSYSNYSVLVGVNPDAYAKGMTTVNPGVPGSEPLSYSFTGTLDAAQSSLKFAVWTGYNFTACNAFGIYDLRIESCYCPKVVSSQGVEVCRGDQTLLSLDKEYNASSYEWYLSDDGGTTYSLVSQKKAYYAELKAEAYKVYCSVNGVNSDTLDIKTIVCCVDDKGNATSRMTVFSETFGHFTDSHTYVNTAGDVSTTPSTSVVYRTDAPFSLPSVMTYDATGGVNDGTYAVVVPTANGYANDLSGNSYAGWMNGVTQDHTSMIDGVANSACLFMNVADQFSGTIFSTQIDGLCTGKKLFFETYIANQSGGADPLVTLNIRNSATNDVIATQTATATANAGWIRLHIEDLEITTTSVILEIVSDKSSVNNYWQNGNDLSIDDIYFRVCSPPSVDLYSNLASFTGDTTICADVEMNIGTQVSDMLNSFYNGSPYYLYQTSEDGKTWTNVGTSRKTSTCIINTVDYPTDTTYFRVVVASQTGLEPFLADPNLADFDNPCRDYSISAPFRVIRAGKIDMGVDQDLTGCIGQTLNIRGSHDGTLVAWNWFDNSGILVPTSALADNQYYNLTVKENDTLYFTGYNKEGCYGIRTFKISKLPTASFTLDSTMACGLTSFTASNADASYVWFYGSDSLAVSDKDTSVDLTATAGLTIKATASQEGFCAYTDSIQNVQILTYPEKPVPAESTITVQTKAGASLSLDTVVTDASSLQWSAADADGVCTGTWSSTVPSQSLAVGGTFYYWMRQISAAGCPSDSVLITIIINNVPAPTVSTDTLCAGTDFDFANYAVAAEGYTLNWYTTADLSTPATATAVTAATAGLHTLYVTQSGATGVSEPVAVNVMVVAVDTPLVEKKSYTYCLNSTTTQLSATLSSDAAKYTYASGLQWFTPSVADANLTTKLTPSSATAGSTGYFVRQYYTNANTVKGDAVCYGDAVEVTVNVVAVTAPVPVKTEVAIQSAAGQTLSLSSMVSATTGLQWLSHYPSLSDWSSTVPSLDISKAGTYYFAIRLVDENNCLSDTVGLSVIVSDVPTPTVVTDTLCEGANIDFTNYVTAADGYTLSWYASTTAEATDQPTSVTLATAAVYSVFVTQKNSVGESAKVPVYVVVAGVDVPTIKTAEYNYCLNDDAPVTLSATLNQGNDYFASGLTWFKGSVAAANETTDLTPSTATAGVTDYYVRQYFNNAHTLKGDAVCYGEPLKVVVTVNETVAPTSQSNFAVSYLLSDGEASGAFADVLTQSANQVAVPAASCTLKWYDADKNPLSAAPTPTYDASATDDVTYTYYVSQLNDTTGCESELVPVTVTVSSAPMPTVTDLEYCAGSSLVQPLTATVSLKDAADAAANYDLLWYTSNPKTDPAAVSTSAITPSVEVATGESKSVYTYYVTQKSKTAPYAESAPAALKVTVYALPVLKDNAIEDCQYNVNLSDGIIVISKGGASSLKYHYSDAAGAEFTGADASTGVYKVTGYFSLTSSDEECASDPVSITVTIDSLSGLSLLSSSVCPNTAATVSVDADKLVSNTTVSYAWTATNGDALTESAGTFTSSPLGAAGQSVDVTCVATAGTCTAQATTTVLVGDGEKKGTITFSEDNNTATGAQFQATDADIHFYSCGTSVAVVPALVSVDEEGKTLNDFVWTNLSTGDVLNSASDGSININQSGGTVTYRVSYTNKCATYVDVAITAIPVAATAQVSAVDICEGQDFSAQLLVSCAENTYTISWAKDGVDMIGQTSSSFSLSDASPAQSGVYSYKVTNRGCTFSDTLSTLSVKPVIKFTVQNQYVARRDSQLSIPLTITVPSASVPSSIVWTETGVEVGTGNPLSLKISANRNLLVSLSDDAYCPASATVSVLVDARLQLAGSLDSLMCYGESRDLVIDTTGTGAFVYPALASLYVEAVEGSNTQTISSGWSLGSDGLLHLAVSPKQDASYSIHFVYRKGEIYDAQSVVVTRNIKVLAPIQIEAPTGLEVCEGDQITVGLTSVSPAGTVVNWSANPTITSAYQGTTAIVAEPLYEESTATNHTSVTNYTYTASYSICSTVTGSVPVKVDQLLSGSLADDTVCAGASATLNASSYEATSYTWTSPALDAAVSGATNTFTPAYSADYQVAMTRGLCSATASLTIEVASNPVITAVDTFNYRNVQISLDGSVGTSPFSYWVDDSAPQSDSEFDNLTFGSHTAHVSDLNGCKASFPFALNAPAINVPVYFSPNGDGENDVWSSPTLSDVYPNAKVTIFDRWGRKLVEYHASEAGWDGTYNGNDMPSTDYWYEIDIKEIHKTYTGHFTLLRQ